MSAPVVENSTAFSKELDYKQVKMSVPDYQLSRILPLSGGNAVNLTHTNGNQEAIFEIPTKPFNFAESILSYTFNVQGQGAGNYAWVHGDTIPEINQVEVYTRSGQFLARIEDTNVFLNVVRPVNTEVDEFLTNSTTDGLEPTSLSSTNYRPVALDNGNDYVFRQTEKRYLIVSGGAAAVANTPLVLQRRIKLSAFVESILAYDKTLMFPEVLIFRVIFNGSRVGFFNNSATNPAAGNSLLTLQGANCIQNLQLYLAVDNNQSVSSSFGELVSKGFSTMVPFLTRVKSNIGTVGQGVISIRLHRGHGAVCKRIYHTLGFVTELGATNLMYDHNNIGGTNRATAAKLQSYYTMLDNNRLQQFNMDCSLNGGEDWIVNEKYLQKSAIQNQDQYAYNWLHVEDFSYQSIDTAGQKDNLLSGLDLSIERKWDFYATDMVTANYNYYTWIVAYKELKITPNMITCN